MKRQARELLYGDIGIGVCEGGSFLLIAHRVEDRSIADIFRLQMFEEDAPDFVDRDRMHLNAVVGMDHFAYFLQCIRVVLYYPGAGQAMEDRMRLKEYIVFLV